MWIGNVRPSPIAFVPDPFKLVTRALVNRFAGTRIEDLQGEIPSLCKDQHGCRYLQKKLEEGVPEHRDMIFRETFGHFADLMTDPFGNYLCQKLLEYSTDDQRNVICEAVAQDLVAISLNMHGTRAVQKMIDFLSTSRQVSSCSDSCPSRRDELLFFRLVDSSFYTLRSL
jgi:hypothetical protein